MRASSEQYRLERLAELCARAGAAGVTEIALTEHLFRFAAGRAAVGDFWREAPDAGLRARMVEYFDHHATADLDDYVEAATSARAAGLPVVVGLEVDYYPGRMDRVARLLEGYPFDVLLGSVHWLGVWMFDDLDDERSMAEWARTGAEGAWRAYTSAIEELAATKVCDVLAHPDLVKVTGRRPSPALEDDCTARMAGAAAASGMAAEISSAGWRKPVGEAYPSASLLDRLHALGVPVTTASDTHGPTHVADRAPDLAAFAESAGYRTLRAFRSRHGYDVPLRAEAVR